MFRARSSSATLLAVLATTCPALAQWTDDPAQNLTVISRPGEQTQPKIVATADGGSWVGWFDNGVGGGYDVYVQRLDAGGTPQLAAGGLLVADRGFSSTQDWDLATDPAGNALLTFRDDRFTNVQITAAKYAPDGTPLWGPTGVQLTNDAAFKAAPKIAATADDHIVSAWTNNSDVKLQRLDAGGVPQWGAGVTLSGAVGFSASDLIASDAGSSIVSIVAQAFPGPRHLHTQKLSSAGAALWNGGSTVAVFDGGSLQMGNFPEFVSDEAGGAIFGWYETGPLQCRVQRVRSNGGEMFGHNGVVASTNLTRIRVNPSVGFDAATNSTYLFWIEQNSLQSMSGIYGQRFDTFGARQWTDEGAVIVPIDATERSQVRTIQFDPGAYVFWVDKPSPPSGQRVLASRVDASGAALWTPGVTTVSSVLESSSRLVAALTHKDLALLAWADGRNDANDVYAQSIYIDGGLGLIPGDLDGNGCVGFADLSQLLAEWGPCVGCPEDLDGDGSVGFVDLNILLGNWG